MNPQAILRYWVFISRTHICIVYILTRPQILRGVFSFFRQIYQLFFELFLPFF